MHQTAPHTKKKKRPHPKMSTVSKLRNSILKYALNGNVHILLWSFSSLLLSLRLRVEENWSNFLDLKNVEHYNSPGLPTSYYHEKAITFFCYSSLANTLTDTMNFQRDRDPLKQLNSCHAPVLALWPTFPDHHLVVV